jgi:hypothetical protein
MAQDAYLETLTEFAVGMSDDQHRQALALEAGQIGVASVGHDRVMFLLAHLPGPGRGFQVFADRPARLRDGETFLVVGVGDSLCSGHRTIPETLWVVPQEATV